MKKLKINNLKKDVQIFSSYFVVKGRRIDFNDISSLEWYWISSTINFINTQNADLTLFDKHNNTIAYLVSNSVFKKPALATLYFHIAQVTYAHRLKRYTQEIDEKGYFSYGGANFKTDATVERSDGKIFSLESLNVEPFSLSLKTGGFFGARMKINMRRDADVIRSLVSFFIKSPMSPHKVKSGEVQYTHQSRLNEKTKPLLGMLSKMAMADGTVSREESHLIVDFMKRILRLESEELKDAIQILNRGKTSVTSFEIYAKQFKQIHESDPKILRTTLDLLFKLSFADGYLSAEEELLLEEASIIFNISDSAYHTYIGGLDKKRKRELVYYYHVFGLEQTATRENVIREYRRLVFQYHPDRNMGIDKNLLKKTQEKFIEIQQAYEYITEHCSN